MLPSCDSQIPAQPLCDVRNRSNPNFVSEGCCSDSNSSQCPSCPSAANVSLQRCATEVNGHATQLTALQASCHTARVQDQFFQIQSLWGFVRDWQHKNRSPLLLKCDIAIYFLFSFPYQTAHLCTLAGNQLFFIQKPGPGTSLCLNPKHTNLVPTICCISVASSQSLMPQEAHKKWVPYFISFSITVWKSKHINYSKI